MSIHLKLGTKFAALGILSAILFIIPTWIVIGQAQERIALAQTEIKGIEYIRPVMHLFQLVQQHRGLSSMLLIGRTEVRPQWEAKRQEIARVVQDIDSVDAKHNALHLTDSWRLLRAKWESLAAATESLQAAECLARHAAVLQDTLDFCGPRHRPVWPRARSRSRHLLLDAVCVFEPPNPSRDDG